jgi:uncharacterized protein YceK
MIKITMKKEIDIQYFKNFLLYLIVITSIQGCTQVVTAPISIVGTAVSTTIDVTGSAVGALVSLNEEEK